MKPYIHTESLVSKNEIELFNQIKRDIESLPDNFDLGNDQNNQPIILTCHMLAQAISKKYSLMRVDGNYQPVFMNHSWCISPDGNIIDVYPCGIIGGPLLVYVPDVRTLHQLFETYVACPVNIYGVLSKSYFEHSVSKILNQMNS
ncbi:MAG: hypothetical protein KBC42_02915 [Candidatus Pacebacteria bacterium]|nr:hypothetical protein [Candidatus Paceibacterota bacterium]MBP9780853.1 hypothetical protein [Candidatus Paceibacterota bacterium]